MKKQLAIIFAGMLCLTGCNKQEVQPKVVEAEKPTIQLLEGSKIPDHLWVEGLELHNKELYVSTGELDESFLGFIDVNQGTVEKLHELENPYYGEGFTFTKDGIWQITYQQNTAFYLNPTTYQVEKTASYEGEGWGLTFDSKEDVIYMSNGSNSLTVRDPKDFSIRRTIQVYMDEQTKKGLPEDVGNCLYLNELEYVDGYIYANLWMRPYLFKIDAKSGEVVRIFDTKAFFETYQEELTALGGSDLDQGCSYLNGIAHIEGNTFYLTSKYFPVLMKVELE